MEVTLLTHTPHCNLISSHLTFLTTGGWVIDPTWHFLPRDIDAMVLIFGRASPAYSQHITLETTSSGTCVSLSLSLSVFHWHVIVIACAPSQLISARVGFIVGTNTGWINGLRRIKQSSSRIKRTLRKLRCVTSPLHFIYHKARTSHVHRTHGIRIQTQRRQQTVYRFYDLRRWVINKIEVT